MTELQKQIIKLYKQGLNKTQIAKQVGCSYKHVRHTIKKFQGLEKSKNSNQGDNTNQTKNTQSPKENKKASVNIIKRKKRELFISDVHIPYHDEKALSSALNYALDEKITDIVLCGDIADFKSVSFWERDANERDLNQEVEIIKNVLNEIREAFPGAKIRYIEGNHEERLRRFINGNIPEFANLSILAVPNLLNLKDLQIEYISNKEHIKQHGIPYQIGKLFHIHGHEVRASWGAVNVARNVFLKTQRNIIMGHFHTTQEWIQRTVDGEVHGAWAVGCLSQLSAPYAPINNWNHGFAIIEYEDDGSFTVFNRKIINGHVV